MRRGNDGVSRMRCDVLLVIDFSRRELVGNLLVKHFLVEIGQANCPNADYFYDHMVSLPFFPWFSEKQFDYLIEKVREALEELRIG